MAGHRLAVAVALRQVSHEAAASHWSAALLHGLPTPLAAELPVHLTVTRDIPRRLPLPGSHPGPHLHRAPLPDRQVVLLDGLPATSVARTVVDLGRLLPLPDALVAADAALHLGLTRHRDLREVLADCADWPGAERAGAVVEFATGRAASLLESRSRALLVGELALPPPLLNPWILDATGRTVTQVAMFWPQWLTVGEPTDDASTCLPARTATPFLRRFRGRELRALGYRVIPWTWHDLDGHPERIAQRIRTLPTNWRKEAS